MKLVYAFLLLSLLSHACFASLNCTTTSDYDSEDKFLLFFDQCFLDMSNTNVWGNLATQFHSWFNVESYPVYVVVIIFAISLLSFSENAGSDDIARGNCIRLNAYTVIMRLGLVMSMVPWLWASLTQERPCVCRPNENADYTQYIPIWGMPSDTAFIGTVVGFHMIFEFNIPLGIIFTLLACASTVALGQFSIGQVIVGILFGVAAHFYTTRTPIFLRFVDFFLTIIAGFIALFIQKAEYQQQDFTFAILFFVGIAWQIYGFILLLVTYEWEFVKVVIRRTSHNMHHVDFMYYKPLNAAPSESGEGFPRDTLWITIATVVLFAVLCGLKVAAQYMNDLFSM